MKNKIILSLIAIGSFQITHSQAMLSASYDFEGGIPSAFTNDVTTGDGNIAVKSVDFGANDYVNFYTTGAPNPTFGDATYLAFGAFPSNSADFAFSVDVSNTHVASSGQFGRVGLEIYDQNSLTTGSAEFFNYYVGSYFVPGAPGFAGVDTIATGTGWTDSVFGTFSQALNFQTANTLIVGFTAADQTFTLSYDSGAGAVAFKTYNIDGNNSLADISVDYGMADGDLFDINIFGSANTAITEQGAVLVSPDGTPFVSPGILNADNFDIVPEPSAYAAIFGIVALAGVVARRRRG